MTSNTYTKVQIVPVAVVAFSLLCAPFVSSAQVGNRPAGDARFCTALPAAETRLMTALDKNLDTALSRYEDHLDSLDARTAEAVNQLTQKRDQVDENWEARLAELRAKARTPEQVSAIDTYASTVETLAAKRRADVNTAVSTFTAGVTGLRATRDSEYKTLIETHRADVVAAFAEAKSACAAGTEPATVASALRSDLTSAREEFRSGRQAFSVRADFTELRQTRVAATTAAREEFRRGFAEASQKLKTALTSRN